MKIIFDEIIDILQLSHPESQSILQTTLLLEPAFLLKRWCSSSNFNCLFHSLTEFHPFRSIASAKAALIYLI
ncbi:hypothetical protein XELAEV_18006053mg [Xenopus laevis]|uniref:Uncharacterized protein n=1 Tax=Xenopus laevis TaxID=8355 RepID=A0A974DY10_XENLA|nr:hypothetical protein XELAEV_18006053mg [Xenopus laevis]